MGAQPSLAAQPVGVAYLCPRFSKEACASSEFVINLNTVKGRNGLYGRVFTGLETLAIEAVGIYYIVTKASTHRSLVRINNSCGYDRNEASQARCPGGDCLWPVISYEL